MRVRQLGGYAVEQYNSPNTGGAMTGHRGPVLHIAQGTYRGTIAWQLNPDQRYGDGTRVSTSSSWIVGRQRGEIAQMCDSETIAWCQRGGSRNRSSIELAGYAPERPSVWQIEACALILAWEHRTYGVPLSVATDPTQDGLGHHSMDREWLGEEWGHDACPGAGVIAAKPGIVELARHIINGGEDDMFNADEFVRALQDPRVAAWFAAAPWRYAGGGIPAGMSALSVLNELLTRARAAAGADQIAAQVLAGFPVDRLADELAAALPTTDAARLVDELGARLARPVDTPTAGG